MRVLAIMAVASLALVGPVEGTSYDMACFMDSFEEGGLVFSTGRTGKGLRCPPGTLTLSTASGKVLGKLEDAEWSAWGPTLPAVADDRIVWFRRAQLASMHPEVVVTDMRTWTTRSVPAPGVVKGWFAISDELGAVLAEQPGTGTADTVHLIDLARASVVETAIVDHHWPWTDRTFEADFLRPRNQRGEFFFLLRPEYGNTPREPTLLGLYTRGAFHYHDLPGVDWLANADLAVSPTCLEAAVRMGTGPYHERPHALWIFDLRLGTKRIVKLPADQVLTKLWYQTGGDLAYTVHVPAIASPGMPEPIDADVTTTIRRRCAPVTAP